jgi:hypothetical protein
VDEQKVQRIAAVFPQAVTIATGAAADSARFIFIVGLPRSGTTLVERILTGLPSVRSNGETDNFASALLAASPGGGRDMFERAAAADSGRVAANYARFAGGAQEAWHELHEFQQIGAQISTENRERLLSSLERDKQQVRAKRSRRRKA